MNHKTQKAWLKYNQQNTPPVFNPEQIITWLEGMRELLFEVWRNDAKKLQEWNEETQKLHHSFNSVRNPK